MATLAAFVAAFDARDWNRAAALVDRDWLAQFRWQQLGSVIVSAEIHSETAGTASLSAVPSDSATVSQLIETYGTIPLSQMRGVASVNDLAALSPHEFLAIHFEMRWWAWLGAPADGPPLVIVGEIFETDTLAHVLYRYPEPHTWYRETWDVEVVQLRRTESGWRLLLNEQFAQPTMGLWVD